MKVMVLGSGQDGGTPQIGCQCGHCLRARESAAHRRSAPSIAVCDLEDGGCVLIDASPDIKAQADMLIGAGVKARRGGLAPVDAVLLTHAHAGHHLGLWQFGREALDDRGLPVYGTERMCGFLLRHYPHDQLVLNGNIDAREVVPGERTEVLGITFRAIPITHRNELADTVAYVVGSPEGKKLLYLPDIDVWEERVLDAVRGADLAIIDGTFYSRDELPRFVEVPHPPMTETMGLLDGAGTRVYFTHINHTNPVNADGPERRAVEERGFGIAHDGLVLEL